MISRLRTLLFLLFGLLYVAGWPGAVLRAAPVVELVAPAIPKEIEGRDGILDVIVHARSGPDDPEERPLAGARVHAFAILDGRAHRAAETESDRDGRATLRALPQAEHWVVAEAPGRARASQMVVVVAGARRLDLTLGPEHTLDVLVKNEQGGAVVGAELELRGADPFPVGGRTGADGRVTVGRLGEGPYTVMVRAVGFEEVTRRGVPEGAPLSITLGKQGALVVDVRTGDDLPAAGAKVLVGSPGLGSPRVTETDANGRVRIAGLDGGSYALRAVSGTRVSAIELGITLARGEEKSVKLVVLPGRMITAHVVDIGSDEDVRDAKVTLAEAGLSPFPIEAVTDKRGRAVLGPIAPGPASLSARAEGYVPRAALALEESGPSEVKLALARGGTLVGRVSDARGYAVDGATIRVVGTDLEGMPIDEDPSRWAFREAHFASQLAGPSPLVPAGELGVMPGPVPPIPHGPTIGLSFAGSTAQPPRTTSAVDAWISSRDGTYRAMPVTPGRVRVVVRHPQYVEALSDVVLLESNKEARIDVILLRGGLLEGRVVDARGRPVSGAHVTALATRGSFEHATRTGTDGSFAFAALPETVTLRVAREEDVTTIAARVEVSVPEAGKKSIAITLPEPRPALSVKVTDPRGSGLDAVQVSAVSLDPSEALRVTAFTDARGRAELASGRGIPLRVEVRAPGRAAKVVLTTAETPELVVELVPAESVTGEVTTRRREPIANADVTLQTETGVRHARTDKDGVFFVGDLPAGPARLRVRAPGRAPEERAIVVDEKGGRKPVEVRRIEMLEEGVIEGTVVDTRGDPIPGARIGKDAVPTYMPVGVTATGMAVADGKGRFRLGELAEGTIAIEAYAADVGRARRTDVRVLSGRTTDGVKLVIARGSDPGAREPIATGGVAITLGETAAGLEAPEVVVVAVSEGSEAERSGLAPNDVVLEVGGVKVASIVDARGRLSGPVNDDVLVRVRRGERTLALRVAREPVRR